MADAVLRPVLGDQLSADLASLADIDPRRDTVLLAEVEAEATYVAHHPKKIALVFAAMRHFAAALAAHGIRVRYVRIDDPDNSGSLTGELRRAIAAGGYQRIVATHPGEWRVLQQMRDWETAVGMPVECRADHRFLCSIDDFRDWVGGRRQLRMEHFYRWMRRRTGLLMEGDKPLGGRWNFDPENRRRLPRGHLPTAPRAFPPDPLTEGALDDVEARYPDHFGAARPFRFPVTREQALEALEHFVEHRLALFGDYQDAMALGEPWMYHSLLGTSLNIGLLGPLEFARRAERALLEGKAPLNAVEGFIRQVIGWREYVRGIYWTRMPEYRDLNHLDARRPLPRLYWTAETDLNCLRQCVAQTREHAYAHHIQRLMVLGNFALLAGIDPRQVNEWYLVVYADAFEWVELPNVTGMVLFADGGLLASKPYAASGAYINRMSDYCSGCRYDVRGRGGADACPFNYLYWDFLDRNRARLGALPRLAMPYRNLDRMDAARRRGIAADAARFLDALD